jgi:hypothetical protein
VSSPAKRPMTAAGRGLFAVAAVLAMLGTAASAGAAGRTYTVVQCDPLNRGHADALLQATGAYEANAFCSDADHEYAIQIKNVADTTQGKFGRVRWIAPDHTAIVGVDIDAKLRRDNGERARVYTADEELRPTHVIASGGTGDTHFQGYTWSGPPQAQLVADLECDQSDGCHQSSLAKTWVRDVRLTLVDYEDPTLDYLAGSLFDAGWQRGTQSLHAGASDLGAGLRQLVVAVNSSEIAESSGPCQTIPGTSYAGLLRACDPAPLAVDVVADTPTTPYHDGENLASVCAIDFARNRICQSQVVRVDNTPPNVAFENLQDPDDPELVRVSVVDATSGLGSGTIYLRPAGTSGWQPLATELQGGELATRVDSAAYPPGQYEFLTTVNDVAGNTASTTQRQNGQPMVLTLPLKSGVLLDARLEPGGGSKLRLPYGDDAKVAGRLTDAAGQPLADKEITVDEYFGSGALIDHRVRAVQTDPGGKWSSRIPAGPSRSVTASFAGTPRYLDDEREAGSVVVNSKASFDTSRRRVREGKSVRFRGRVRHRAARIPDAGKLVELQVHEGAGQWNTVGEALHTDADGHYRLHYRFGRFYTSDVRYRFRVKVDREQGWPYRAPARTRARKVKVLAR